MKPVSLSHTCTQTCAQTHTHLLSTIYLKRNIIQHGPCIIQNISKCSGHQLKTCCFRAELESLDCTQTHHSRRRNGQTLTCRLIGQTHGWHLPFSVCVCAFRLVLALLYCYVPVCCKCWTGQVGRQAGQENGRRVERKLAGTSTPSPALRLPAVC